MPSKTSIDSFLDCLRRSGLLVEDQIASLMANQENDGVDVNDSRAVAKAFVAKNALTAWQAENLLRGKHRGFQLGKYRLLGLLGRGGMGAVYLAEHSLMRRRCAIKVLPTKNLGGTSHLARFHREAQAVALLDHSNIVRAYDVDKAMDGSTEIHFFVMEYVEGVSLHDRVMRDGPLPIVEAAELIRQAADGLAHAHAAGIIHRDIKPANLLVDRDGVIKILDLGLAKLFDDAASLTIAHDEGVMGTADYLSPEQALDSHAVDERSDIYSLGCTFYFLLCGEPPFSEGTLPQRLLSHQIKEPMAIARKRADVPAALADVLGRMIAKKPAERFQTADEIAEVLRQWLAENAEPEWLRKHANILGGSTSQSRVPSRSRSSRGAATEQGAPARNSAGRGPKPPDETAIRQPRPPHATPAPSTLRLSKAATNEFTAPAFDMVDLESAPLTQSIIGRRRSPRSWVELKHAWGLRRKRDVFVAACGILTGLILVGVLIWAALKHQDHAQTTDPNAPNPSTSSVHGTVPQAEAKARVGTAGAKSPLGPNESADQAK